MRLSRKADFQTVFQKGKKQKTPYFAILIKANGQEHARLGIVIGKKAVSSAVVRNQIKRIFRESFRYNQHFLSGKDIVIVVYNTICTLDRKKLRSFLDSQWIK